MLTNNLIGDIWAITVKEWKMLFLSRGNRKNMGWFQIVIAVGLIGIYLPWFTKETWITDPMSVITWAWMPIFWSMGIITSAIAGEREAHTLETLLASRLSDSAILIGKMMSSVLYGWGLMFISTLVGAVVVNVAFIDGPFLFYPLDVFFAAQVGIFLMAMLFSELGVMVSLKAPTARQAYQRLSIATFVLYLGPMILINVIPQAWLAQWMVRFETVSINWQAVIPGILIFILVVDIVLYLIAKARFQRTKLILA